MCQRTNSKPLNTKNPFSILSFQRFAVAKVTKAHKLLAGARQRQRRKNILRSLNASTIKTSPIRKPKFRMKLSKARTLAMVTDCNLTDDQSRKLSRY